MKMIDAVIQPSKLDEVKDALSKIEVVRMTISEVKGFGRQKGYSEIYKDQKYTVNLLPKIELRIAVNDEFVESTVAAIEKAGRTGTEGRIGDGKIFIWSLEECVRIRTGERGKEAV
jgi:nitrogen regulatory protein P-II 1